jgi:hypothetical protein
MKRVDVNPAYRLSAAGREAAEDVGAQEVSDQIEETASTMTVMARVHRRPNVGPWSLSRIGIRILQCRHR